jgi:putative protease
VRLHRADDSKRSAHKVRYTASGGTDAFWIDIPDGFGAGDSVYLISDRSISRRRYAPVLVKGAASRGPGFDKAPSVKLPTIRRDEAKVFPEGVYAAVSRVEDMYVAQSVPPAALILEASVGTLRQLLGAAKPLPFKPGRVILSLPPFFAEADAPVYEDALPKLAGAGYTRYIANNLAHIPLLKRLEGAAVAAGPYLYTFNRFAAAFLEEMRFFVTPLENNRQNLERCFEPTERAGVFVTLFAYPRLFRVRASLGDCPREFADARGERFRLVGAGGTRDVIPDTAFSIADKVNFLRQAGFRRFIADFSGPALRKPDYKTVMTAIANADPVNNTSRFNWKDGFYQPNEQLAIRNEQ